MELINNKRVNEQMTLTAQFWRDVMAY